MKKITLLMFIAICTVMSGFAEKFYLKKSSGVNYMSDGALVAVWSWVDGGQGSWGVFSQLGSDIAVADIQDGATGIKIVRFASGVQNPDWSEVVTKWNQTGEINKPSDKNMITLNQWDGATNGDWDYYETHPIVAGAKLYLTPNANWNSANARFAAYFYAGTTNVWADMAQVVGTGMYEVIVPAEGPWEFVIFCRMNPEFTENRWNSGEEGAPKYVWNQSFDLAYDGTNNHYIIAEGAWDKGDGTWSFYEDEQGPSTAIEETENAPLFSINGRTLNVAMDEEAEISIYTISGQMIEHTIASDFTREMQQGVYVIRIGSTIQKVVVS